MTSTTLRLLAVLATLQFACAEEPTHSPDEAADSGTANPDGRDAGARPDATVGTTDGGARADAGTSGADASTASDGGSGADAGVVNSCGDISAKACLSNPDCNASEVCQSFSGTAELRCCVAGARGQKQAGDSCTGDRDCAFGRCLERDDQAKFCSGECDGDLDCPGTMFCSVVFHWCVPHDAGEPPTSCSQVSLPQCFFNDNCSDTQRCENLGTAENEVLCCTVGARGTKTVGQACASELECKFGRCIGGLCSEACDLTTDPCPPATMECNIIREMCEPKP